MKGTSSYRPNEATMLLQRTQSDVADTSIPMHRYSDAEIVRMIDEALLEKNKAAFEQAISALWQWAHYIAVSKIRDRDMAQDLVQDALLEVYRVAQQQQLTGKEMVGLTQAKLAGWRNVPGLVTKYRAAEAERHRREISIFEPLSDDAQSILDKATSSSTESTISLSQNAHLAQIDMLVSQWRHRLPHIANMAERETLQAILAYVEACRAEFDPRVDGRFKVVIGSFKRRWDVSPDVLDWFKAALKLKREAAIRDRLWRIQDLLQLHGLSRPSILATDLADVVAILQDQAKYLWREPTDRKTLQVVCGWFQQKLDYATTDSLELEPLLIRKESQFMLDKRLSAYLQSTLGLSQNTVRKRIDRVLTILTAWGLMEDMKDE